MLIEFGSLRREVRRGIAPVRLRSCVAAVPTAPEEPAGFFWLSGCFFFLCGIFVRWVEGGACLE